MALHEVTLGARACPGVGRFMPFDPFGASLAVAAQGAMSSCPYRAVPGLKTRNRVGDLVGYGIQEVGFGVVGVQHLRGHFYGARSVVAQAVPGLGSSVDRQGPVSHAVRGH